MSDQQQADTSAAAEAAAADSSAANASADQSASTTTQQDYQGKQGDPAQSQQADTSGKQADQGKAEGAPESYDFKAPEGQEFNPAVIGKFSEVAKTLNLSQEKAQSILDAMSPVMAEQAAEAQRATVAQWEESAKADKEFGGANLDQNLAVAKKALDQFGTPELVQFLNETGLGSNPEMIRAFYRAGKAISEDRIVTGGGAAGTGLTTAQRMYPGMNP